jgi:hypothetical protein
MDACFSEKTVLDHLVLVQDVEDGVSVFGKRGGEDNDFKLATETLEEDVDTGTFQDVDVVDLVVNFDGDDKVGVGDGFEG